MEFFPLFFSFCLVLSSILPGTWLVLGGLRNILSQNNGPFAQSLNTVVSKAQPLNGGLFSPRHHEHWTASGKITTTINFNVNEWKKIMFIFHLPNWATGWSILLEHRVDLPSGRADVKCWQLWSMLLVLSWCSRQNSLYFIPSLLQTKININ